MIVIDNGSVDGSERLSVASRGSRSSAMNAMLATRLRSIRRTDARAASSFCSSTQMSY